MILDLEDDKGKKYILPPPMAGFFEFSMMRTRQDIDQKLLAELYYQYINEEEDFIKDLFYSTDTKLGRVYVQEEVLKNQNAKYYLKIFVINTIKELFPFYKKEELKSKIIPVLEKLKNDQISNIQNSTNEMLIFLNENLQ